MNILSIGYNSAYDASYSVCRETMEDKWLLLMMKSRGFCVADGKKLEFGAGSAILFDGTIKMEYGAEAEPFVCDWIFFETGGDTEFIDTLELELNVPRIVNDAEFVSSLIRNIESEFYSQSSRRVKMLDTLMRMLLIKLGENSDSDNSGMQTADPHYSALMDLRSKIYRNPQQKWNVDTMAADVNMSRSYFQHIYREVFGVSCITDVINGKIEKAKEILSETSCTVAQVAAMCGYDNEEHFMRQFKKIVGVTPTKYRKMT